MRNINTFWIGICILLLILNGCEHCSTTEIRYDDCHYFNETRYNCSYKRANCGYCNYDQQRKCHDFIDGELK